MNPAEKPIHESDDRTEMVTEQPESVNNRQLQNVVKLLIMILLTYIVIFT